MEAIFENNSENELEKLQGDSELCLRKRGPEQGKTNICMSRMSNNILMFTKLNLKSEYHCIQKTPEIV